jgi:hypothetical protein
MEPASICGFARRAYQAMFCFLSGDDLKQAQEWDLFVRFCEASKLGVDPAEVDMLEPPWPDLKAEVFGHAHYFELGEIVQQNCMKALAQQGKKPIIDSPLRAASNASLVVALFGAEPPRAVIEPLFEERKPEIRASFENSVFDHLWLFVANENRIPFSLSKKLIVALLDER